MEAASFPGRQGRLAFAYLAAHRRAVPRDELGDAIWADRLPRSWEHDLAALVSKLRSALAAAGLKDALVGRGRSYELVLPEGSVDIDEARLLTAAAEDAQTRGDVRSALEDAKRAAELARATVMPGETADWIERCRDEQRAVLVRALAVLADALEATGDRRGAIGHATEAVTLEPYRESGYVQLMKLQLASGDRAEAVRTYERCRALLAEELGVDPSPQTEAVYLEALRDKGAEPEPERSRDDVTVMLVDDHPLWRETLRQTLELDGSARVVAEAGDGREAVKLAAEHRPDVVIMDMELPVMDGVKATKRLVKDRPDVRVLVLSASSDEDLVLRAIRAGARGYMLKTAVGTEVADAVRRIAAGELVLPADVASIVLAQLGAPDDRRPRSRSPR